MDTANEELMKKIEMLEEVDANLREEFCMLMLSGRSYNKSFSSSRFNENGYLNILHSMGHAIHIYTTIGITFFWNRAAESLYGYSDLEAVGADICDLIIAPRNVPFAKFVIHRCGMGQCWEGQFPVRNKMGKEFSIFVTCTPFIDDDGIIIGTICIACESKLFKDKPVFMSDEEEVGMEMDRDYTNRLGLDAHHSLQTAITSKITNLASKVSNKVRSKMKIVESTMLSGYRENENSSEACTPRGDLEGPPLGSFFSIAAGKSRAYIHIDSIGEGEGKHGINKILTSKAEAWIGKKAMQWSGKSELHSERLGRPRIQGDLDSNHPHFALKPESQIGHYNRPSGSWSSFSVDSTSSSSSSESGCSNSINKLGVETDILEYEIMWDDLTIGDQIGRGSCGTVYHGLWYGSDVAIKVFSKQEYSEEVIFSFRQEVSLMKRLRHPNILLFMGAVTSPQRLCIVTEFLPRGSLFQHLQRNTSKLDWRRQLQMALDIARGMNYLHKCSPPIVHRDLKSSNLLVDKNLSVKVADFGLSRVKHETYLTTKTGRGTPQWMAPEVLRNERSDEKSDLYSFGVILWELATQKIPWEHLNQMQVIGAVGFMNQRLDIPEDIDPRWASLIESCWLSDPQGRPTFQEMLEKLKDMQRQTNKQYQAARAAASAEKAHKEL